MRLSTTQRPTRMRSSSIGCWRRRTTASDGRGRGSTWRATPTRTGSRRTRGGAIWPYRDWVINALNKDMPFDQFTIEQIAGDLLPDATLEQRIATGFHRNTMINTEGGVDPEEYRVAAVVDRVNTTATVWLGTTLACAQCHTHKYDPFTQQEYYQFLSFFNSNADASTSDGDMLLAGDARAAGGARRDREAGGGAVEVAGAKERARPVGRGQEEAQRRGCPGRW